MADDMPYDRIRERERLPELVDETGRKVTGTPEQLQRARAWQEHVRAARESCFVGECVKRDCDGGRRCPFRDSRIRLAEISTEALLRAIAKREDLVAAAAAVGGSARRATCVCGTHDFGELQLVLPAPADRA